MQDWWQATFPHGRQTITITDANGYPVSIAYGEKGTGQPLFLLHGIAGWSYSRRCSIEPLAQHFRVICFDAKGSGFSEKPLPSEKPGHQIVEMERVIRALCDQPAIAVAESLGALTALAVAEEHPELFSQLVVANVPIFPTQLPNWGMRLMANLPLSWFQAVDQWRLARLLAPALRLLVYFLRQEVVADPSQITTEDVYWLTYPYVEFPHTVAKLAEEFQLAADEIRRLNINQPNLIRTIQDRLAQITCPTLVLWGDRDRWFPASDGEKLRDRLPNAQLIIIPNCGHHASGCQPELVNAAILSFLLSHAELLPG